MANQDVANQTKNISKTHYKYNIGEWVVILYDNIEYPGEIVATYKDSVKINVMYPSRGHYIWPNPKDENLYDLNDIIQKICPPEVTNNRANQFRFPDYGV